MSILSLAILLFASNTPDATAQQPKAMPAKVQKICRELGHTGSRVVKKTCKTADEWVIYDEQNQKRLERLSRP
jgi:hypothetical protein